MEETVKQLTIDTGWQLRARTAGATEAQFTATDGWTPANVPGVVQQDLLAAGRIPDPFVGLNEHEVRWVGERDWLYRCRFDLPEEIAGEDHVDLCFDGLDTIATVWLNGEEILRSDNQFVPHRVPVKALLRPTGNELRLSFDSALLAGQALQAHYGPRDAWNGDPSRVYVRKAGYNYGWDWGPVIMTAGPWRPIHLEAYGARIASLHAPAEVAPDLRSAAIPVAVRIATGTLTAGFAVALALRDPSGNVVAEARVRAEVATVNHLFTLTDPQLWWPRGHGAQPLYILTATLMRDDIELDRQETRLGLRRLRLVHEAVRGEAGQSFLFEVNNAPIFGGGYNWIPADSLPTRVTPERYRAWLELAAEGHTAMLRVWGGGYYEDDVFYDLCDELGILVWQDFMFACGMYPAHPAFLASVRREAEAALRRLRHHPSLVLWCGNNEDYQIAGARYDPAVTTDLADSAFPARAIYERLLPEAVAALDPTRPYWPGSPYGGLRGDDPTIGDRHIWGVWHGAMLPYQDYPTFKSRFVSEFGMASTVGRAALDEFVAPDEQYPESRTFDSHLKASGGGRRLASYLVENIRHPHDLDSYIFGTRFIQAEALAAGVRGWRRGWRGPGDYACSGALVWQLNDCWPVTSWATVDYRLRPKPAFYTVKRELAPLAVALARAAGGTAFWAINATGAPVSATIQLTAWTLSGERVGGEEQAVELLPYRATACGTFAIRQGRPIVIGARLIVGGEVVHRASLWPEPYKYLDIPDPQIAVERAGDDILTVHAARPAKGVILSTTGDAHFLDNALDLFPDDPQQVGVRGLGDAAVQVDWLRG